MNRKLITVAILIVLGVVALGFSQGWFALSSLSPDTEDSKVSTNQVLDQGEAKADAVQVTPTAPEAATTPTE